MLNISIKSVKGVWAVLIALCMATSTFCLCYAGAVFMSAQQEKAIPFELVISTQKTTGITETMLSEIREIADVEDVTPVLQIPVQINMGGYSAELVLTGVMPSYLDNENRLPEESVMPYILLNEAACKSFLNGKETTVSPEKPNIDWLETKVLISRGEEIKPVASKVVGIMESGENDEPVAYISLNAAKALMKTSVQSTVCTTAYVRVKNIGCAESISGALSTLGLMATNADAGLQAKWDIQEKEMTYLIVLGVISLLCSTVLLAAWQRLLLYKQKHAYEMLYWMGIKKKEITKIFTQQSMLLSLLGGGVGILIALVLPSFLSQDLKGISIFMLPIQFFSVAISGALCAGISGIITKSIHEKKVLL